MQRLLLPFIMNREVDERFGQQMSMQYSLTDDERCSDAPQQPYDHTIVAVRSLPQVPVAQSNAGA
jgi:hypothetical protein